MQFILFMLAMILVIVNAGNAKKKKQRAEEAKREAERRAVLEALNNAENRERMEAEDANRAARYRAAEASKEAGGRQTTASEGSDVRAAQSVREIGTTLRERPVQHRLEASQLTGHAHEETSLTGVQEDCAPEKPFVRKPRAEATQTAPANDASFVWDADEVRNGLILSEILGKPRCMRQGASRR